MPGRSARFRPRAKAWLRQWRLAVLSLVLCSAVLATWLLRSRPVLPFAARDWVLVADFENQTHDSLFDQSLLTAFSVSLEESRYANMSPRSRVREVLARMKKNAATKIDEAVGREIAVREGIRALILPSISGVGEDYRLAARIRDVKSGMDVKTTSCQGQRKAAVFWTAWTNLPPRCVETSENPCWRSHAAAARCQPSPQLPWTRSNSTR